MDIMWTSFGGPLILYPARLCGAVSCAKATSFLFDALLKLCSLVGKMVESIHRLVLHGIRKIISSLAYRVDATSTEEKPGTNYLLGTTEYVSAYSM